MRKELLGFLVFIDAIAGGSFFLSGIVMTFSLPWVGWGLVLLGLWMVFHFYYLVWGVEECLLEENK